MPWELLISVTGQVPVSNKVQKQQMSVSCQSSLTFFQNQRTMLFDYRTQSASSPFPSDLNPSILPTMASNLLATFSHLINSLSPVNLFFGLPPPEHFSGSALATIPFTPTRLCKGGEVGEEQNIIAFPMHNGSKMRNQSKQFILTLQNLCICASRINSFRFSSALKQQEQ